jgi:uncharacterized protein
MNFVPPRRSDGTLQTRRTRQPWPKDKLFRILSIDGGRIKGVFLAAYLAEIEKRFLNSNSIASYFDMVAGTSTGGIIALGLAHGMTGQQTLGIYLDRGETIFPTRRGLGALLRFGRWLSRPKHDQEVLKAQLLDVFGDELLDDARVRLAIPSFEGRYGEPYVYKTPHHPDYKRDRHQKMAHAALHTAAAPSFYAGVENDGYVMVDGGLWANNPVMIAVVDALACFDIPPENIRVLSIGTGDSLLSTASRRNAGLAGWILPDGGGPPLVFRAAVKAQSHNAIGQAGLLIGRHNLVRIDPFEGKFPIEMDDASRAIRELPEVARSLAESSGHRVAELFFGEAVDPFVKCPPN